jgi:small subunit ribosomal protein S1
MSEQVKSQEFFSNFNWHNFEEGIDAVDEKNLLEFEALVSKHLSPLIKKKLDGVVKLR